jgi:hypothetical protein
VSRVGTRYRQAKDSPRSVEFPDLRAVLHLSPPDARLARELPERYSSCFSTIEYFTLYDHPGAISTCELDDPRHVFFLSAHGRTVDVLNKLIDIEPDAVVRLARTVFRTYTHADRIRLEVKFPPDILEIPLRVRLRNDDLVIPLPATVEEYRTGLGRRTRQNVNQYTNRLRRRHPDFELKRLEKEKIPFALVRQVAVWNAERMHKKGERSIYEEDPRKLVRLWRLLQSYGVALCGHIDGDCVAAQLLLHVGHETWVHTAGFDSAYEDLHLGLLMAYFTVVESIDRACTRMHMLWGTPIYKQRLGARPVPAYQLSLFRSESLKSVYAFEKWHRDELSRAYWRNRKRAKRGVVSLARVIAHHEEPNGDRR